MGWTGATDIFDGAVETTLKFIPVVNNYHQTIMVRAIVDEMYKNVDWGDWDTQDESRYFSEYLVHVMYALGELDDEDYDDYRPV